MKRNKFIIVFKDSHAIFSDDKGDVMYFDTKEEAEMYAAALGLAFDLYSVMRVRDYV